MTSAGAPGRWVTAARLGRRDQQIKLRGFRIELGDIEAVVSQAEGVRQCAVVAAENKKRRPLSGLLRRALHQRRRSFRRPRLRPMPKSNLPGHMVPSFWVTESELPQTANGKLDRKTLQQARCCRSARLR